MGVDVFFVLSGFLIASVILHDLRDGSFLLREFYLRRVQRLMPNGLLMILVALGLWTLFLPPSFSKPVGEHGLWALANLSNVFIRGNLGSYWGGKAQGSPLLHTWSLAIEEQFYLVFPVGLVLLARFQRSRIVWWFGAGCAASFALCLYNGTRSPDSAFYLLPSRAWELLLGSMLAAFRTPLQTAVLDQDRRWRDARGWAGLLLATGGFFVLNEKAARPGLVALTPALGTLLLLASVSNGGGVARLLSWRPLVIVGKMSYSLYLWHWPFLALGLFESDLHGFSSRLGRAAGLLAGMLAAWGAYRWVEHPMRERGSGRPLRLRLIAAGAVAAIVGSAAAAHRSPTAGAENYFDRPEYYGRIFSAGVPLELEAYRRDTHPYVYFPPEPVTRQETWRSGGVIHDYGAKTPEIAVLGSSLALMYSPLIDGVAKERGLSVAFLAIDTVPLFREARGTGFGTPAEGNAFYRSRTEWLRMWHPKAVFAIDVWDRVAVDGRDFKVQLREFLAEVQPFASRVFFVSQVPSLNLPIRVFSVPEYAAWLAAGSGALPRFFPDAGEAARRASIDAALSLIPEFPGLKILRPDLAFYGPDGSVRWHDGRTLYYVDRGHLSEAGTGLVRGLFEAAIAEAAEAK